jgi:hypothetical protein
MVDGVTWPSTGLDGRVGCFSGRRGAGGVVGQALPCSSACDVIDYPLHFKYELVPFYLKL